jgi:CubicO group peptidase (beta-lactamase class C family)
MNPHVIAKATLCTVLAIALAGALSGQPAPETVAGKILTAWLAAFNSADAAQLRAFNEAYRREAPPVEDTLGFREATGGFALLRIEQSEPRSLVALVQEKGSDAVARLELALTPEDPPKIARLELRAIPRPADLAIPRLTEAQALAALSGRVEELARKDQFSGAVLIARHGKILLQRAWGRADRETGAPVTLETRFRLGSMNKMFTATAILQLVEAGRLTLDDPLGKFLPDYPNREVATKVTVRHLLTHTGGTGDIFGPEFEKNRLALRTHGDYLKLYGARAPLFEPGKEWRYSNYGFVLLGAIIEKVSGMSYYDYVQKKIFAPSGMSATASLPESEPVPNRAKGYLRKDGAWVSNADTLPFRGTAAGGGYSTVGDLFRFAQALGSGKLLSPKMLAEATKVQREQYGYGFGVQGEGRLLSYGHGGGAPGMNGDLRIYPELGYVLVALSNLDPPAASRVVDFFALRMPVMP